jgi:hypothetical protein
MDETTLLRAHVERVLEDYWEVRRVERDAEGDYPYRCGTAACWVQVRPADGPTVPPAVVVVSKAALGLKPSAGLRREIIEMNDHARWCKVSLDKDQVWVERILDLHAASPESVQLACWTVGAVADDIGTPLAVMYGGSTPYTPDDEAPASPEA